MVGAEFVHLHVHTEYSLLDGMIRVKDLVDRAVSYQMPAVAITDHGMMSGAVAFYEKAREKGIKPIIGCEVYVAENKRTDHDDTRHHLVLLCKNYQGYQNLCRMVSASFTEGFYYKPRIDYELLRAHNDGLIALSACLHGEVATAIRREDPERAAQIAGHYAKIFDRNRFYLELQENGIEEQLRVNRELISIARKLGLPLVATNDCHYLTREMAASHEILLCIGTGKTLADTTRMKMSTDQLYFRPPGEMKELFAEVPEAISNTIEIANRCNLEWDLKSLHFPKFEVPEDKTLDDVFAEQVHTGFHSRLPEIQQSDPRFSEREAEYKKRLEYEISVIRKMGFASYFLIVADFVSWAKRRGIPVGPGRGSAAGSLVSYCLSITGLNPIPYSLLFERFLNPERKEMPDIDMDFCKERREEVYRYVIERYGGPDHVSQIITFGTLKPRAVLKDVGRVMGLAVGDVNAITKLVPAGVKTLKEALEQEPRLREMRDHDPLIAKLLSASENLEGISRHASIHASGVVISDKPLRDYLPLYKASGTDEVIAQYDMKNVAKVGLVKFDLLGLKNLTMIKDCLDAIERNRGQKVDVNALPLDDPDTYQLLGAGDAGGVFQLESSGMRDLLTRLMPGLFDELIAIVALYRPGPMGSGDVDRFIERKHGREKVSYLLPQLEPILKETYGVMLYQEQVMEIAVKLAGYSMGEADGLRKAMGKKDPALMESQKGKFVGGAVKNGIKEEKAKKIFDDMAQFAGYGFNKSHAAVYALIAYQTAWLKHHFPTEFFASLCTTFSDKTEDVVDYLKECQEKKIPVDPPHVNDSGWHFRADGDRIRIGMCAVKGVGEGAAEAIIAERKERPFASIYDLCERIDLKRANRKTIESLIKAGSLDNLGAHRAQLMAVLDQALEQGHQTGKERDAGQSSLFDLIGEDASPASRGEHYPEVPEWASNELLAHEKAALGFYLTGHPLAHYEGMMKRLGLIDSRQVPLLSDGQEVMIGGVMTARKDTITKKNERMSFITLTDLKGSVEVTVFPNLLAKVIGVLEKEDLPLLVRGRVKAMDDPRGKVNADDIMSLEDATERLRVTLHLTVRRPQASRDQIKHMSEILRAHPGRSRIMVHVIIPDKSETIVSLPSELRANANENLLAALDDLFGEGCVRMEVA